MRLNKRRLRRVRLAVLRVLNGMAYRTPGSSMIVTAAWQASDVRQRA